MLEKSVFHLLFSIIHYCYDECSNHKTYRKCYLIICSLKCNNRASYPYMLYHEIYGINVNDYRDTDCYSEDDII